MSSEPASDAAAREGFRYTWPFFALVSVMLGVGYVAVLRSAAPPEGVEVAPLTALFLLTGTLYWLSPFLISTLRRLVIYLIVQGAATFAIGLLAPHHWLMLALYGALMGVAAGARWPDWRAGALAVALCLSLLAVNLVVAWGVEDLVGLLPSIGLMSAFVCIYVVLFVRQLHAREKAQGLLRDLEAAHRRLREYAQRVEELTLSHERERMGRELHDTLAQGLAGLTMQLEAIDGHLENGREARAREVLQQATRRSRTALREARRAIQALRPEVLEQRGLIEAVGREVDQLVESTGIACAREVTGDWRGLPAGTAQHVLRVVQEALANVARHARATSAGIRLERAGGEIRVTVEDDGAGFDPAAATAGFGLEGMRQRAARLGGELRIDSAAGRGTRIMLVAPEEPVREEPVQEEPTKEETG